VCVCVCVFVCRQKLLGVVHDDDVQKVVVSRDILGIQPTCGHRPCPTLLESDPLVSLVALVVTVVVVAAAGGKTMTPSYLLEVVGAMVKRPQ
jgi:hypothetical protein